jgi:hypothetical protein
MRKQYILFAIATVLSFAGCSSSTSSNPTTTPSVRPKIGSSFTYDEYTKNQNHAIDTSTRTRVTYTLTDTAFTLVGKSNVYHYPGSDNSTEMDVHYETNGDVSLYIGFRALGQTVFSEWITMPVSSKTTFAPAPLSVSAGGIPGTVTTNLAYAGSDTTGVGTQTLSTIKTSGSYIGVFPAVSDTVTGVAVYQYAPQFQMLAKSDITVTGMLGTNNLNGGQYQVLRSYTIK